MTNEVEEKQKNEIIYFVDGREVKLSPDIVSQFITKGNAQLTTEEVFNFMQLAKFQELNPFLNEVYLIKFNGKPAQMVVSKEAFMKRAEKNPHFRGLKAGILVARDDEIKQLEGAVKLPKDTLIGGWAEVYRDDRAIPTHIEISFSEFSKGQATWNQMPNNMIRKTAIVNALREAFPNSLGAMYTEDDKELNENNKPIKNVDQGTETVTDNKNLNDLINEAKGVVENDNSNQTEEQPEPVKPVEEPEFVEPINEYADRVLAEDVEQGELL